MPTLIEREARLLQFLAVAFPNHRIAPGFIPFPLQESSPGSTPEIRVICDAVSAEGMLRWRINIVPLAGQANDPTRAGQDGILATAETLREVVRGSVYTSTGAQMKRGDPGAVCWEEILQEPFTPADAVPQSLFAYSEDIALLPTSGIAAGVSNFGEVILFDGAEVGAQAMLHNNLSYQYLGAIVELNPFRTEFATTEALPGGIKFRNLTMGISASEPADELEQFEPGRTELPSERLDGLRVRRETAVPSATLALRFPSLAAAEIRAWNEYLRAHANRPSFLLVRADRSIIEASVLRSICTTAPRAGAAMMEIQFDVRPIVTLGAFAEESS
ncbi:hypothetical protein BH09SUM1_BH09SUM1_07240 [soil metagenome]